MKAVVGIPLLLAAFLQGGRRVSPEPRYFRYSRVVAGATITGRQVCTVLDADVMAHAQATLSDLRLMVLTNEGPVEIPYALTRSQPTATAVDQARVLHREIVAGRLLVDLEMPARPYSEVRLQMGGKDFVATARVTGLRAPGERIGTPAGTMTLFDLGEQKLGRDTTLRLAEASFPVLRLELAASEGTIPDVTGAEVPPSRDAQTLYTTVATAPATEHGRESVATFTIPAGVPLERVSFDIAAAGNFNREVRLRAHSLAGKDVASEEIATDIARIRLTRPGGQEVREDKLNFAATLGSNARDAARVEVAVENAGEPPLPLKAIRLEMRRRQLCFNAPREPVILFYGDPDLVPPDYPYAAEFRAASKMETVGLGPEKRNPRFIGRDPSRSVTERHPELVWLILLGVISVFGVVGFRTLHQKA